MTKRDWKILLVITILLIVSIPFIISRFIGKDPHAKEVEQNPNTGQFREHYRDSIHNRGRRDSIEISGELPGTGHGSSARAIKGETPDKELEYYQDYFDDYYDDPEDIITYPDEIFDFNND